MCPSGAACCEQVKEFPAHSANVNCLRIGRKSSQVLVTGGDDKKVNVWAIGKPNAILSLAGHTSPVESVCFDSNDEVVVAGASSGTVKLWDLEQGEGRSPKKKILNTQTRRMARRPQLAPSSRRTGRHNTARWLQFVLDAEVRRLAACCSVQTRPASWDHPY